MEWGIPDPAIMKKTYDRVADNPSWNLMQIRIEQAGEGWVFLRMPFRPDLLQVLGTVHGGFLTMLADSAAAAVIWQTLEPDQRAVTVDLSMHFIRPVLENDVLAHARFKNRGKRIILVESSLLDAGTEKQVAFGLFTFLVTN